ncbi:dipeptide/oligopeptide/nickel ABC transporter permease/ATP-binding protein [Methylocapsa sp. S129]|uniref:dipeptide/oligopeptide/nickel ABC transporter permease/ATP-binding protein n=1 Tax=Methylocapsa sp. S129 TaxID=1641869 RepID=UPI00131DE093|nr:dipeptide/oligopeptide/nickel ABC transporter permease/ATP-binding protein [Methylocapsa sp. S129]
MRRFPWVSASAVAFLVILALLAPYLALPDPTRMDLAGRFAAPHASHLLGQDEYGRDVLSRLVWGARVSLSVSLGAALLAAVVGVTLGVIGGYLRGGAEFVTLRLTDILLCFPPMLLALLIVTLFGPGARTLIPVLAIVYAPSFARVAYAGALTIRSLDYVTAIEALGAGRPRIMARTILPNIAGPVLVQFSLAVAASMVLEAGLSFLGLGVTPPAPSWGLMIGAARATMSQAPQLLLWPCAALTAAILSINALCDGLRDYVDPQPAARRPTRLADRTAPGLAAPPSRDTVLSLRGLSVAIDTPRGAIQPVRDVSFDIKAGETLALVGESGSGKSLTGLALMGLLPPAARVEAGRAWLDGIEVLDSAPDIVRGLRGDRVAMIFQDPMSSLNPVHRVGDQIAEVILAHRDVGAADARSRAVALLRQVGVPDPPRRAAAYPHEMSGGMCQRVMIGMAVANGPRLLIADEPTTALDVTVQAQVLTLMSDLKRETGVALLFITHNLPVVAEIADRVVVLYAGQVVEQGDAAETFAHPRHPYTKALLGSAPREEGPPPEGIPGSVPSPGELPSGCCFAPRCAMRLAACERPPPLVEIGGGRTSRCIRWSEM